MRFEPYQPRRDNTSAHVVRLSYNALSYRQLPEHEFREDISERIPEQFAITGMQATANTNGR